MTYRQPPENSRVALVWWFDSKPRPHKIFAALDGALSASIASSSWYISLRRFVRLSSFLNSLLKRENMKLKKFSKQVRENFSNKNIHMELNFSFISRSSLSRASRFVSHSNTLCIACVSSPITSCSTWRIRMCDGILSWLLEVSCVYQKR